MSNFPSPSICMIDKLARDVIMPHGLKQPYYPRRNFICTRLKDRIPPFFFVGQDLKKIPERKRAMGESAISEGVVSKALRYLGGLCLKLLQLLGRRDRSHRSTTRARMRYRERITDLYHITHSMSPFLSYPG